MSTVKPIYVYFGYWVTHTHDYFVSIAWFLKISWVQFFCFDSNNKQTLHVVFKLRRFLSIIYLCFWDKRNLLHLHFQYIASLQEEAVLTVKKEKLHIQINVKVFLSDKCPVSDAYLVISFNLSKTQGS